MTTKLQLTEAQKHVARRAVIEGMSPIDMERDPLPPGHPLTWGLINDGTCLAGEAYPIPANA